MKSLYTANETTFVGSVTSLNGVNYHIAAWVKLVDCNDINTHLHWRKHERVLIRTQHTMINCCAENFLLSFRIQSQMNCVRSDRPHINQLVFVFRCVTHFCVSTTMLICCASKLNSNRQIVSHCCVRMPAYLSIHKSIFSKHDPRTIVTLFCLWF